MSKLIPPETPLRQSILSVLLNHESDFLLARQRAKQIASIMGFEVQDQTRIATAVSEIARNAFEHGGGGRVEYFIDPPLGDSNAGSSLRIVVTDTGRGIADLSSIWAGTYQSATGMGKGLAGARRLLDSLEVETNAEGTVATLVKRLPPLAGSPPSVAEIARQLTLQMPSNVAALRDQNQELLGLLNDLRVREGELQTLNREIEETNRGVLVLYSELEDKALAVQQASEMKTRFLSSVTHELRTPLNSIVSLARLLLAHTDGELNSEQGKQVQFILRSAQNLTEMVNDLLDLAKIEAGKTTVTLSEFSVADIFTGLRGMFRPLAINEKVQLLFDMPSEPLNLSSDEGKLSQILRNFISNALKFTAEGSVIVSAAPSPGSTGSSNSFITFSVKDTGIGIAADDTERVMQEWGQIEGASHNKQKGSGLGLPLSRRLAELLGGTLTFDSAPGVGSTFRVTLPALLPGSKGAASSTSLPSKPAPHILMVDDDEVARYLLRRQLSSFTSATIAEATSGQEALDAIRLHRPNLLFLDLIMPGLSGTEVARQLRANPETQDLPIILHTSKTLSGPERQSFDSLNITVIPKRNVSQNTQHDRDDLSAQLERALLEVGLSNMHQTQAHS